MNEQVFSVCLFEELLKKEKSLVICPLSIYVIIALVSMGAKGETLEELTSILNSIKRKNLFELEIEKVLKIESQSLLQGNAIFVDKSVKLKKEFETKIKSFDSIISNSDFQNNSEKETKIINDWVSEKTKGHIKSLIPDGAINNDTMMILVNAIYFKSTWKKEWKIKNTEFSKFTTSKGEELSVKMMNSYDNKYEYGEDKIKKWVLLPYKDEDFAMYFILPKTDIFKVVSDLKEQYDLRNTQKKKIKTLSIPKFKMDSSFELKAIMKSLGVKISFTDNADFSDISNVNVKISEIYHKSTIEVDEKGTVATGATATAFVSSFFILRH